MHRFFLPPNSITLERVLFPEDIARQIRSVLRLRVGQRVICLDGLGREHEVELLELGRDFAEGRVHTSRDAQGEPHIILTMYLALTQRDKFEWMLQKCTEVGATAFTPLITTRSLIQDGADVEKKTTRWERILREAAEQSGRGRVPQLNPALPFEQALEQAGQLHDLLLIPYEQEAERGLRRALNGFVNRAGASIAVCIGPEGGFTPEEVALAQRAGFHSITLGKRILRMETAAVVAAALVLHEIEGKPTS